jgi:hypothetical protein
MEMSESQNSGGKDVREIWQAISKLREDYAVAVSERRYATERMVSIEGKLERMEGMLQREFDDLSKNMVSKERYQNVERIVYGIVAIILTSFLLALATMVISK